MRSIALLIALCATAALATPAFAAGKKPHKPYFGYLNNHTSGGYGKTHAGGHYSVRVKSPKPAG